MMNVDDTQLTQWILLEEDGLIAVDKPAGMPTAGDDLEQPGSLQFALMQHYRRMIWAVHQLDRDTSGVNLFVRRKSLVAEWTERLSRGRKIYLAVCAGRFDSPMVDAPVGWVGQGQRGVTADGKPARTEFVVRAQTDEASLLEAVLHTGRTHQIRIHAAHVGHPLLGDERYGGDVSRIGRQALHAWKIEHDAGVIEAPLPADIAALVASLGLD